VLTWRFFIVLWSALSAYDRRTGSLAAADTSDNQDSTAKTGIARNVILSASQFLAARRMFHKGFGSSRPTLARFDRFDPIKTNF
jgi:hypothetical protein